MTRERLAEFFTERQKAWDRRDIAALATGHARDGVVLSPIFGTIHGRAGIEKSYADLFTVFHDWVFTGEDLVIDGDRVAQPFIARATHVQEFLGVPGTNRRFEIHGVLLYHFVGDLIERERRIYDFSAMLIQIGVLKAKPAGS